MKTKIGDFVGNMQLPFRALTDLINIYFVTLF